MIDSICLKKHFNWLSLVTMFGLAIAGETLILAVTLLWMLHDRAYWEFSSTINFKKNLIEQVLL